MRSVLLLLVLGFGLSGCSDVASPNEFILYGRILNGPPCTRLLANSKQYELIGLPAGFVADSGQMRVIARASSQYVSACMVGPILDVISIRPAP